jgi:hypothetical protein
MTSLTYLANVSSQIDKTYSVSLEYGAHGGDTPRWHMRVALPLKGIVLTRHLVRGDDIGANLEAARSLGEDLKRAAAVVLRVEKEAKTLNPDTYELT